MTNFFSMLIGFLHMTIITQAVTRNDIVTVVLGALSLFCFFGYMLAKHKAHQKQIEGIFRGRLN